MNKELYEKLLVAGNLFLTKKKTDDEIAAYERQIKNSYTDLEEHYEVENYKLNVKTSVWVILGRIFIILSLVSIGPSIGLSFEYDNFRLLIQPILLIIFTISLYIIDGIKANKKKAAVTKEYETKKEQLNARNKELTKTLNEQKEKINEIWAGYTGYFSFLPEKYQNVYAVSFMLDAVASMRADTLKEAINLWEDELKWIKDQEQKRQYETIRQRQNEQMLAAMSELEANQELINSNLRDIKFMQYVDYMKKQ